MTRSVIMIALGLLLSSCSEKGNIKSLPVENPIPAQALRLSLKIKDPSAQNYQIGFQARYATQGAACRDKSTPAAWAYVPTYLDIPIEASAESKFVIYRDRYLPDECNWRLSGISFTVADNTDNTTKRMVVMGYPSKDLVIGKTYTIFCTVDYPPIGGLCFQDRKQHGRDQIEFALSIE